MCPRCQRILSFAAPDRHVRLEGHEFLETSQTPHFFFLRRSVLSARDVIMHAPASGGYEWMVGHHVG
ncbi:hypothetical protein BC827DRAFT_1235572 [Russula dissimulans]|nr:hypothetical protein BC827DRAFT_1235572 [Russula dissimulans]